MCLPLIIEETLFSLSDKFNVFSLKHEERGFRSLAVGPCASWFKKNEMKDKLCNFDLF